MHTKWTAETLADHDRRVQSGNARATQFGEKMSAIVDTGNEVAHIRAASAPMEPVRHIEMGDTLGARAGGGGAMPKPQS